MPVNLKQADQILAELGDDTELATKIADAMAKLGHRWHDTPPGRTPTSDEVQALMMWACGRMATALREDPSVDRQRVGTGGITVYYWRWSYGSEEIELRYSPEGFVRSWNDPVK